MDLVLEFKPINQIKIIQLEQEFNQMELFMKTQDLQIVNTHNLSCIKTPGKLSEPATLTVLLPLISFQAQEKFTNTMKL